MNHYIQKCSSCGSVVAQCRCMDCNKTIIVKGFCSKCSEKPNCNKCVHRRTVPGDAHSRCNNFKAKVVGNPAGRKWFLHPFNFDPIWLVSCDGFSIDPKDNLPEQKADPLLELMAMLR